MDHQYRTTHASPVVADTEPGMLIPVFFYSQSSSHLTCTSSVPCSFSVRAQNHWILPCIYITTDVFQAFHSGARLCIIFVSLQFRVILVKLAFSPENIVEAGPKVLLACESEMKNLQSFCDQEKWIGCKKKKEKKILEIHNVLITMLIIIIFALSLNTVSSYSKVTSIILLRQSRNCCISRLKTVLLDVATRGINTIILLILLLYASVSLIFCFGLVIFKKLHPNSVQLQGYQFQRISIIPLLLLPDNLITSQWWHPPF